MIREFCITILLTGCVSYTNAQVGPARFAITSKNLEYTKLLEMAYSDCRMLGKKDYVITNSVSDSKGTTLIIQCVDEQTKKIEKESDVKPISTVEKPTEKTTVETPPAKVPDEASTAEKIWKEFKDTFAK